MAISHAPLERKRTRHRVKRWRHVSRLLASFAVFRQDDSGSANRIECDRPYVGYSFHLSFHNLHTEGGLEAYERYFGRPLFAPWAERVVVDVNDAMLEVACGDCRRTRFGDRVETGDATALPFPDEAFDVAFCQQVLHIVGDLATVEADASCASPRRPDSVVRRGIWTKTFTGSTDGRISKRTSTNPFIGVPSR